MADGTITKKQQQILDLLKEEIMQKGYPPTVRELCRMAGLKSTSSVHAHLEKLEKNGYIRRDPSKPRAIEITDSVFGLTRRELVQVPVLRAIAEEHLLEERNIENYFPFPSDMLPVRADVFMARVPDDSMKNAGVYAGDLILVEHKKTARDGDMVVAMDAGSAVVRTFYKEKNRIRLQPENDGQDPVFTDHAVLIGKVIGLYRSV